MTERERQLVAALERARHSLATLHGLHVVDGAAPGERWRVDEGATLAEIDAALRTAAEGRDAS